MCWASRTAGMPTRWKAPTGRPGLRHHDPAGQRHGLHRDQAGLLESQRRRLLTSHDLGDVLNIVDGRELLVEMAGAPAELQANRGDRVRHAAQDGDFANVLWPAGRAERNGPRDGAATDAPSARRPRRRDADTQTTRGRTRTAWAGADDGGAHQGRFRTLVFYRIGGLLRAVLTTRAAPTGCWT